jgi:hypothetical protein
MKKIITTLSLTIFIITVSQAQRQVKFTKSNTISNKSEIKGTIIQLQDIPNAIFNYGGDVCTVISEYEAKLKGLMRVDASSQVGLQLVRYNKQTKKLSKPEIIKCELRGTPSEVIGYLPKGDSLLIVSQYANLTKKKRYGFATYYNLKTKKAKSIKIAETNIKNGLVFRNTSNNDFVLYSVEKGVKGESGAIFDYIISDYQGNIKQTRERVVVKDVSYNDIQSLELTEKGNIIILAKKVATKAGLFKAASYEHNVYIIKDGQSEKLDIESLKYVSNLRMIKDDVNNLYKVYCLTSEGGAKGEAGFMVATINEDKSTLDDVNLSYFDDYEFDDAETDKKNKKEIRDLKYLNRITGFDVAPDGTLMILAEYFYVYTNVTSTGRNTTTTTHYVYGPGVIFSLSKNNKLLSHQKFAYRNSTTNRDPGAGFTFTAASKDRVFMNINYDVYEVDLSNTNQVLFSNIFQKGLISRGGLGKGLANFGKALKGEYFQRATLDNVLYEVNITNKRNMVIKTAELN